jgi:hypothetical protein
MVAAACGGDPSRLTTTAATTSTVVAVAEPDLASGPVDAFGDPIPPAPAVPDGPLAAGVVADLDRVFADPESGIDLGALDRLGHSGDARVAWLLSDLLRFFQFGNVASSAETAFERLTDTEVNGSFPWGVVTDRLIAWDLPEPPGYVGWKRRLFLAVEPAWAPFFDDADAELDWRWLSWGGVLIDDRTLAETALPCAEGCIPALDDPGVTDATGGDWYADHRLVFGVVVNGEARAYPKHIMEIHEMVNDTVGGRRIAVPYCTLCGSAQAYFTDTAVGEPFEFRTSGLLSRSNKVMFEYGSFSLFDTFGGRGLSGPLQGVELEMITVRTSTWGDWKAAHPGTTIVARDGGIGRTYPDDPLQGRDDGGPIFPIGAVDPRLPVQWQVLGVVNSAGIPIAFPAEAAKAALAAGEAVRLAGIEVRTDGAGLTAWEGDGMLASHQAFWFAWSQFHPTTLVWTPLSD